jgi:hypothetical protein
MASGWREATRLRLRPRALACASRFHHHELVRSPQLGEAPGPQRDDRQSPQAAQQRRRTVPNNAAISPDPALFARRSIMILQPCEARHRGRVSAPRVASTSEEASQHP